MRGLAHGAYGYESEVRQGGGIHTASGEIVFPLDPRPEEIHLVDIATALSHQCRFSGHCKVFYSVAEHSIRVRNWLKEAGYNKDVQCQGLLHDASEAFLVDLPRPIKHSEGFGEFYRAAEDRLMEAISERFGLSETFDPAVKLADQVLLSTEQRDLMPPAEPWYPEIERIPWMICPMSPDEAREVFLWSARDLGL
jgi:uncharacterized protein